MSNLHGSVGDYVLWLNPLQHRLRRATVVLAENGRREADTDANHSLAHWYCD
jgi:hypothetical protein